jgi:hypothetical protein
MTKRKNKKIKKPIPIKRIQPAQNKKNPYLVAYIVIIAGCVLYLIGLFLPFLYTNAHTLFAPQGAVIEAGEPFAVPAFKLFIIPGLIYVFSAALVVFLSILGIIYKNGLPWIAVFLLFFCGLEVVYHLFHLPTRLISLRVDDFTDLGAGGYISIIGITICMFSAAYIQFYEKYYNS